MSNGIYVGVNYSEGSKDKLKIIMDNLKIPNQVSIDSLHTTIIYSKVSGKVALSPRPLFATAGKIQYFKTQNNLKACVLVLNSFDMKFEHKRIMEADRKLTYDYSDYIPHITLSYDVPESYKVMKDFTTENIFFLGTEYREVLKDFT